MSKFILTITILIISIFSLKAQSLSDVIEKQRYVKELKNELRTLKRTNAYNSKIIQLRRKLETQELELKELRKAHRKQFKGSLIEYLQSNFGKLETEWGPNAACEIFNKAFGGENLFYTFEGYIVEYEDYVYLYADQPLITTTRIEESNKWREELLGQPRFESKVKMKNDSLIYGGYVYLKCSRASNKKPYDCRKANYKASTSNKLDSVYRDTTTKFILQFREKKNLLRSIKQNKEQTVTTINQLNRSSKSFKRAIRNTKSNANVSNICKRYSKELSIITEEKISSNDTSSLKLVFNLKDRLYQSILDEHIKVESNLINEIKSIEQKAFTFAKERAETFFIKSWEPYYVIINGIVQVEVDIWEDAPYIYLKDWAIKNN